MLLENSPMAPPPLTTWRVVSRKDVTHDVFELVLERPQGFSFRGGQYISIVVPGAGPGGRNLRRAYSIASPPESTQIELCIKTVPGGPGTTYLGSLRAGQALEAQGPFGSFYLEHDLALPSLFIGTGTGLAPLRSMVLSSDWKSSAPLAFLLGVRSQRDIIYPELFSGAHGTPFFGHPHVKIALSRPEPGWDGFSGRVTHYVRKMEWDWKNTHAYLCGSGDMLAEIKSFLLEEKGVSKEQIHTEKYY
jgi:ferredoxin-NADP reductase